MSIFRANLHIDQGATFCKPFIWKSGGELVDLTGYTAACQIRSTFLSPTVLCELTTENGGIVIEPTEGKFTLLIGASQTDMFDFSATGAVFDVELYNTNNANDIVALVGGLVKLNPQVTRAD